VTGQIGNSTLNVAAVITAAGKSTRMGGGKKELLLVDGVPVIEKAVSAFVKSGVVDRIAVTFPPQGEVKLQTVFEKSDIDIIWVPGGDSRQKSVYNALVALADFTPQYVLIHDAARPWIAVDLIIAVLRGTEEYGACIPVVPHVNAPKKIERDGTISEHLDKTAVVGAQTPQGFRYAEILKAHKTACAHSAEYPDDAEAYHRAIGSVRTIPGDPANRKITFGHDL